jgi:hypothetical protein
LGGEVKSSEHEPKNEPARGQGREPIGEQVLILRDEVVYRAPLEGEVMPQAGEQFDAMTQRMSQPFDTLWWLSLGMTVWLVWLTLRGDPSGVMNILLALVLMLPFLVLSLARWGLSSVLGVLRAGLKQAQAMPNSAQQWQATMRDAREQAKTARSSHWAGAVWSVTERLGLVQEGVQTLMLTPLFLLALVASLLATLIMLPVTLFTLLLMVF